MLISDIDRNNAKEKSDTIARAGVRAGHLIVLKIIGMVFDSKIPLSKQVTKSGSLKP